MNRPAGQTPPNSHHVRGRETVGSHSYSDAELGGVTTATYVAVAGGGDVGNGDFTDAANARGGAARVMSRCRHCDARDKTILLKWAL